jgi:hypothetical protein
MRGWLAAGLFAVLAGPAAGQTASPPPVALRAGSGTPLAETFTPDTLFPKTPAPPPAPPPVGSDNPEIDLGDGLLPGDGPPPPPPKIWAGGADLGLNGATGNSELLNIRANWNVRRRTDRNAFTSDLQYVYSNQNDSLNTHQALLNSRSELLFPDSRWSPFAAAQVEFDQLRAYRFRVGAYGGVGYTVYDTPDLVLKLRAGAGATRELGVDGNEDRWVPELLFGYDFRYRMNDRSTFVSILDVYPRLPDVRQWRARARAAYEYVLDPATGTVIRFGVQDRYDSDPGNAKRNDLNYFVTFGFKF